VWIQTGNLDFYKCDISWFVEQGRGENFLGGAPTDDRLESHLADERSSLCGPADDAQATPAEQASAASASPYRR
jgi:hypothetical protein